LARLLAALEKIETGAAVRVLVADNDAEKQDGFHLSRTLKSGYRWPLDAISVAERGIAQVRNALLIHALDKSDADFIAMLDDDEWPEPQWLKELLRVQAATGADVLSGSVLFDAPGLTKGWAGSFDGLAEIRRPTGLIAMLEGAGNMLIERRAVENMARPFFDPAFALTGGEDRDFFMRLRRQGARFAWADKAVAITSVPQTRASLSWALKRAYSIGNNDMRMMLKHEPGAAILLREVAKIAGVLLLSPFLLLILGAIPNRRAEPLRKLFRNAGKLMALFGVRYSQYAVIHGE
jgi:glycosyltransferase involved in cell wall biosynthesis